MLETPTRGRYYKEEKFLVFEPAPVYIGLVWSCIVGGFLMMLYGLFMGGGSWFLLTGMMVFLAGCWANMSLVRIRFDFKTRMYRRRQGPGFVPRLWQGSIDEIDAIQVVASPSIMAAGGMNIYIVLHWKQNRAPLMVIETETRMSMGGPAAAAQPSVARAMKFGSSLRVPVYDNTQQMSSRPVTIWN